MLEAVFVADVDFCVALFVNIFLVDESVYDLACVGGVDSPLSEFVAYVGDAVFAAAA